MSALPPKADIGTGPYHDEIIAWLAASLSVASGGQKGKREFLGDPA